MRTGIASLICVLALGLASLVAAQGTDDNLVIIEQILVNVNGQILTQTGLETLQIAELRRQGMQPTTNAELARMINEITPAVVASEVDELLLVQRGKEMGWRLSDEQFADIVENVKAENDLADDEALAEALMAAENLTIADLRKTMEREMIVSQVQQMEVLRKVNMTDTEAREYYDAHIDEFTDPARAAIRELLVAVPEGAGGINVFADEQAKTVAQTAAARVRNGEDFAAVAEEVSDSPSKANKTVAQTAAARVRNGEDFAAVAEEVSDSPSKANGGLIGPLLVDDYSDTIQNFIRESNVGDVSDPIRTPLGYQVVMLEERIDAVVKPFEQFAEGIKQNVFGERRTREFNAFLESLREEAIIVWKNEELRLAYERYRESGGAATAPF